jgi:DNA polymerase-1
MCELESGSMAERKKLMLIDGHALAFRAFYALENAKLSTSQGEPTYGVFGFLQILLTAFQEQHPQHVAVAFDVGRTFRDDMYAEYKADRGEAPAEFHPQLERMQQALRALNIPIYTAQGFEADDVIGTLARQATAEGLDTVILTGDTDTLQLVDEHVHVLLANPYGRQTTTTLYDLDRVHERYDGLEPGQLADLRGLKGDKSDNIPGIKGIGDKTAIDLLKQFGSVEEVFANMEMVPTRHRKKLDGQQETAEFSKQLSVIRCDVPHTTLNLDESVLADYDRSAVVTLFQELEFGTSLLQKLPEPRQQTIQSGRQGGSENTQLDMFAAETSQDGQDAQSAMPTTYRSVTTEEQLQEVLDALADAPCFAFDLESTSLDALRSEIVGIALAVPPVGEGRAWYIPLGHHDGTQLARQHVLDALRPFLSDPDRASYAHNAKFDIELLAQAGIEVRSIMLDTMLAAILLGKRAGLKELALHELGTEMTEITALIGSGKKQRSFAEVPIQEAAPYAAADADMTLRLADRLHTQLEATPDIRALCYDLEVPLVPVLVAMERAGIGLDVAYMRQLGETLGKRIMQVEDQIYDAAGEKFNINSGIQLGSILFEKLGLPTAGLSKTATGRYSLTADALEKLSARLAEAGDQHEILEQVLHYRQLAKLKSTYVDALPDLANPQTGRIHTSFNQLGAATGRLSSNNPNLQNIPVRTEEGNAIRRAFVAAPDHVFVAADYSQIELRVLAHITEDPNLVQVFQQGQDIHAATAAQLFGVPAAEVDKNQRRIAKTVVFGVIYGISSFGLAQRTDLGRSEAQALIDALFARFPGIRAYIDRTLETGRNQGYVQSLFGRRRSVPDLSSENHNRRQAAEREAINAPIQATAADIMKLAMLRVAGALEQHGLHTRLLLQVHDELIFEVPHDEIETVRHVVRDAMENVMQSEHPLVRKLMQSEHPFGIPLGVDIAIGPNWEEMEEIRQGADSQA